MEKYEVSGKTTKIKIEYIKEDNTVKILLNLENEENSSECIMYLLLRDALKLSVTIVGIANEIDKKLLEEVFEELKNTDVVI